MVQGCFTLWLGLMCLVCKTSGTTCILITPGTGLRVLGGATSPATSTFLLNNPIKPTNGDCSTFPFLLPYLFIALADFFSIEVDHHLSKLSIVCPLVYVFTLLIQGKYKASIRSVNTYRGQIVSSSSSALVGSYNHLLFVQFILPSLSF